LEAEEVSQDTYPTTPSIALQASNLKGRSESQLCNSTDTPVLFKGKQQVDDPPSQTALSPTHPYYDIVLQNIS
jgi:hypothetical protein